MVSPEVSLRVPHRERLSDRRAHEVFRIEHDGLAFIAGIGRFPDGRIGELFINTAKLGTAFDTVLKDSAILLSFALQYGADVAAIRRAMVRIGALLDKIERADSDE
jgi:hypothetical protein